MKLTIIGKLAPSVINLMVEQLNGKFDVVVVKDASEIDKFRDTDLIVLKGSGFTQKTDFEKTPKLKYLQKWGAGLDAVDLEGAGELGIAIANVPGGNAYSVAELAVTHMLNLLRHFPEHNANMKAGVYDRAAFSKETYNLRGKLVGLMGGGNIGRMVAERVRVFGADVQYYDLYRLPEVVEKQYQMQYVTLDELFRTSDLLSLHVPLTPETKYVVNADAIASMKDGAYIINTARGGLIDEAALVEALKSGKLRGAGLDCIEHAPITPEDPLLTCPNVTLTPHVGGTSADLAQYMVPMIVKDICDFADGKEVHSIQNRKYMK